MLHVRFEAQRGVVDRMAGGVAKDYLEQHGFVDSDGCRLLLPRDGNGGRPAATAGSKARRQQERERNGETAEHGSQAVAEIPLFHAQVQRGAGSVSACGGNMW